MILCEFTPTGGDLIRISTVDVALTYQWFCYIKSLSSVKFALPSTQGGYAKPAFSDLQLWPGMFEELSWPPANTATVKLMWTETDEDLAITLFEGTANLDEYDRDAITYAFAQPEFDETISESTAYSGGLKSVMSSLSTTLGLDIDYTQARSTSPTVSYTTDSDVQAIDLMSDMCEFFTHGFYIADDTLYLFDMLEDGTTTDMTEFDFLPSTYGKQSPISLITSDNGSVSGSNSSGDEESISTEYCDTADVNANLRNIRTMLQRDTVQLNCMITDTRPGILECFTTFDESTVQDTTFAGRVSSIIYNFDTEKIQIEGVGVIS